MIYILFIDFLNTDTVLFYADDPPALLELQKLNWSPIINWFNERLDFKFKTIP